MKYFKLCFFGKRTSKSPVNFTLAERLDLDKIHFRCSDMAGGFWSNHCKSLTFSFINSVGREFMLFWCILQFSSVAQSCPTLCDPMNHSTPSLPVHHQLPEFTQAHIHRVGDAIQPSHPWSSPSPPAPNPSQHQSVFQ